MLNSFIDVDLIPGDLLSATEMESTPCSFQICQHAFVEVTKHNSLRNIEMLLHFTLPE